MKLSVNKDPEARETEISVRCSEVDGRLERLIRYIGQYTYTFQAKTETGVCFVPAEDVCYIDSVDGRTFLYLKEKVFGCAESLAELESKLADTSFARISKNCIVNVSYLRQVNPLWNHRLEAVLTSGEKLIVTRHYIENLKEKVLD